MLLEVQEQDAAQLRHDVAELLDALPLGGRGDDREHHILFVLRLVGLQVLIIAEDDLALLGRHAPDLLI